MLHECAYRQKEGAMFPIHSGSNHRNPIIITIMIVITIIITTIITIIPIIITM